MSLRLVVLLAIVLAAAPLPAAAPLSFDFEKADGLADCPGLQTKQRAAIVPRGPDERGQCLALATTSPSSSCSLTWRGPLAVAKNQLLSFDYRAEVEAGYEGSYVAIGFFQNDKQVFWTSKPFSTKWQRAEIEIGRLKDRHGVDMKVGLEFSSIQIYAKVKEKTKVSNGTKAQVKLWLDNLAWCQGSVANATIDEDVVQSYANPPLFNWEAAAGASNQRIEYSKEADFPPSATQKATVRTNFFTPPSPLAPGLWYWRVWSEGPLMDAYSPIRQVEVLSSAHTFQAPAVPVARIAAMRHPRLMPLARLDQPEASPKQKAEWVKQAQKIHKRGVPEHPGPHVEGDPRWPTWIEWYGKVAGGITGSTGRRLQSLGQFAMLGGDDETAGRAKELLLEACRWDPEGGSAMRLGDIGAHHLLRGMNWCYDASYQVLSPTERENARRIMIQRAEQFWHALNPSRGIKNEANNHAWLKALALAECGIVLLGEHAEAADWVEFTRQMYVGRFLPCLGMEGENNEGISYWNYGLGFIIDYADLMRQVAGIDLYQHPWLYRTARFPMYCAPPGGWAVSFADTGMPNHGTLGPAEKSTVRTLALRTRDPYSLWYSGATDTVDGLTPKAPRDLPQSVFWPHIGVGIFHTDLTDGAADVAVAMHAGRFWAGHQHPDQNHFVIHAYGEKLAIDGGYYDWYGSPHFKAYSMNTLSHNTLLVDGEGQAACTIGADGRTDAWFDAAGYGYMQGDASAPLIYGGKLKQFTRKLLFIKPCLVIVYDEVATDGTPRRLDWLLHAVTPIATDQTTITIEAQRALLRGQFLCPAGLKLEVKTGFPVEPVNRYSRDPVPKDKYFPEWTLHATPLAPTAKQEFLFVAQIAKKAAATDLKSKIEPVNCDNGRALRCTVGQRQFLVALRGPNADGMVKAGRLATDGALAVIEIGAGDHLAGALAIAATKLELDGKPVWQSERRQNWARP